MRTATMELRNRPEKVGAISGKREEVRYGSAVDACITEAEKRVVEMGFESKSRR